MMILHGVLMMIIHPMLLLLINCVVLRLLLLLLMLLLLINYVALRLLLPLLLLLLFPICLASIMATIQLHAYMVMFKEIFLLTFVRDFADFMPHVGSIACS